MYIIYACMYIYALIVLVQGSTISCFFHCLHYELFVTLCLAIYAGSRLSVQVLVYEHVNVHVFVGYPQPKCMKLGIGEPIQS